MLWTGGREEKGEGNSLQSRFGEKKTMKIVGSDQNTRTGHRSSPVQSSPGMAFGGKLSQRVRAVYTSS